MPDRFLRVHSSAIVETERRLNKIGKREARLVMANADNRDQICNEEPGEGRRVYECTHHAVVLCHLHARVLDAQKAAAFMNVESIRGQGSADGHRTDQMRST